MAHVCISAKVIFKNVKSAPPFLYFLDFNKYHWWGFRSEPKRLIESTQSFLDPKANFFQQRTTLFFTLKNVFFGKNHYFTYFLLFWRSYDEKKHSLQYETSQILAINIIRNLFPENTTYFVLLILFTLF